MASTETKTIQGYIYIGDNDERSGLFHNAKAGDSIVKSDKEPPCLVVDYYIEKIIVGSKWPGKLYYVEVLDPDNEEDLQKGLRKDVHYRRTWGVKILNELPLETLFGKNGINIMQVIEMTNNITEAQVDKLALYPLAPFRELYSNAWKNWTALTDPDYVKRTSEYFVRVLGCFPNGQMKISPIGNGLSIVSDMFNKRVNEIAGEAAYEILEAEDDEDDDYEGAEEEGEMVLKYKWITALEHLLHAAMSWEEDGLLTEQEKEDLRLPVNEVFGLPHRTT